MTPQLQAAWQTHEVLAALGHRHALIGGLAVQFWGRPRFTRDVDMTVLVEPGQERKLAEALLKHFDPRFPDAVDFALAHRVLLLRSQDSCDLDISFGLPGYESQVMDRAVPLELGEGRCLPVISAEDLLIHKFLAARPRDLEDARAVLLRQRSRLDLGLVRHWLSIFSELQEDDTPLKVLENLLTDL